MILLSPDASEGGEKPAEEKEPKPAAPVAAKIVANGKSEKEIELEQQLEAEKKRLKKLETDVAHLQDENKTLREVGLRPEPPKPQPKASSWTSGIGFND